jgi:hypothetical protein
MAANAMADLSRIRRHALVSQHGDKGRQAWLQGLLRVGRHQLPTFLCRSASPSNCPYGKVDRQAVRINGACVIIWSTASMGPGSPRLKPECKNIKHLSRYATVCCIFYSRSAPPARHFG